VLVDDVVTSGGHLRACAAKLTVDGAGVPLAVCAGRTLYDQEKDAFEIVEESLKDYEP
jgi:orotate phosphoribosyltransferase